MFIIFTAVKMSDKLAVIRESLGASGLDDMPSRASWIPSGGWRN
jgi:hypothetical protein